MKTSLTTLLLLGALSPLFQPSLAFAQGSLTPPGAPAPTMKTLDQIEARTPISTAPFTISAPGSYYLTGNLAVGTGGGDAVVISTDGVTLDLNGFTVSSTASPASGYGVRINGVKNVTVRNGHVRGATTFSSGVFTAGGFIYGVRNVNTAGVNLRVTDVSVHGVSGDGIDLQSSDHPTYLVERCVLSVCGGSGIRAGIVRDCGAKIIGANAISGDIVTHCSGQTVNIVGTAFGILATSLAENCRGIANTGTGVNTINANNCRGTSTSGVGLTANASAHNCEGISTSGAFGINIVNGTASFCRGQRASGTAISALNAVACTTNGGIITATNKSLGTP